MTSHATLRNEPCPGDERAVREIVRATGFFREDEVEVAAELVRERLAKGPESGYEFLLADGPEGTLQGYACFGPIACTVGSWDLYWIAVDPLSQGRGLGRALMREVERRIAAMAGRMVYAETSSQLQYAPTRRFYLSCGYAEVARLPHFYQPGDDKVIYGKPPAP